MIALPIIIPEGFSPVLSVGDAVQASQILAQRTKSPEEIINIAEELGLPLHNSSKTLRKKPGDIVKNGDIIAIRRKLFGWKKEAIVSRVDGLVLRFERDTGNFVIQTSEQLLTENILSPVDGIVAMCDNGTIVINTEKNIANALSASGRSGVGEIFILDESFDKNLGNADELVYRLDSQSIGKVVIGGLFPRDVLMKGIGIGAAGIIGVQIADEDFAHLSQKNITTPVMLVDHDILKKLVSWKGKKVFIDSQSKSIIFLQM